MRVTLCRTPTGPLYVLVDALLPYTVANVVFRLPTPVPDGEVEAIIFESKSLWSAIEDYRCTIGRIVGWLNPEHARPLILLRVLPVANPDTGWKPMLHYTVAWSLWARGTPFIHFITSAPVIQNAMPLIKGGFMITKVAAGWRAFSRYLNH